MEIEIFVQGDELPEIKLVWVPQSGTVRDVVEAARKEGLPVAADHSDAVVLLKDTDQELNLDHRLEDLGIGHGHHLRCHRRHKHETVTITIDTISRHIHRGKHTVADIKTVGGVMLANDLEEVVNGVLTPLGDDAAVTIKGGEVFLSHPKDSGSS